MLIQKLLKKLAVCGFMMFVMVKMVFVDGKEVEGKLPDGAGDQPHKTQGVQALDDDIETATCLQQQTIVATIELERDD